MDRPKPIAARPTGKLHRLPMAPAALAMMVGLVAGRYLSLTVGVYAFAGVAALTGAVVTFPRRHLRALTSVCLLATIVCLSACYLHLRYFSAADDHIVRRTATYRTLATLRGRIVTAPALWKDEQAPLLGRPRPPRTVFVLAAGAIRTGDGWSDTSGLVRVTVDEGDERLAAGQQVELVGRIGRFYSPTNPGQFDYAQAARDDGVHVQMSVPAPSGVTIHSGAEAGWARRAMWHVRAAARQHVLAGGQDEDKLVNALVLGERDPALRQLNDMMVRTGLAHFLSISGLHLGVFLGFVFLICRLAQRTPRQSAVIVLGVLAAYLLLAEPRPPLLRSAVMATALCAATIVRRRPSRLNALAVAAVVLLLWDPMQLFNAGFQLSFTIVVALLILYGPVKRLLFGRWLRLRGLIVFRQEHRVRRWLWFTVSDRLMAAVAISLTAYLAAAPLVAHHFGLLTPWAPLLSVLLLPLVAVVLVFGYISIMLAWPLPNLSRVIGQASSAAAGWLTGVVDWLGRLPGMGFELRPVGWWWVLACYAVMAMVVLRRRWRFGRAGAIVGIVLLAGATAWTQRPAPAPPTAQLHLLSVGAGQCAVLRTPSGQTFLFDAGSQTRLDVADRTVRPFLRHLRMPNPTAAFISHANTDHFNALPDLLATGSLQRVYVSDYFGSDPPGLEEQPVDVVMRLLRDAGVEIVRLRMGSTVQLDDRTAVEVLWPPEGLADDVQPNDRSLVLRIICDGRSVIVPGDAQELAQRELMARADDADALRADAMILPHHGSWQDTLPTFVARVSPEVILISSSQLVADRQSDADRLVFYSGLQHVFCTRDDGWIRLSFGDDGLDVRTMEDRP